MGEVVGLFERESPRIFGKARFPSRISGFLRSRYSSRLRKKGKAYRHGGWSIMQRNDIRHNIVCFELLVQKTQCGVAYRRAALSP